MTVDRESLKALRAAAEAATPGPWCDHETCVVAGEGTGVTGLVADLSETDYEHLPNAAYIALANPAAIIELIDAYERLEKAVVPLVAIIEDLQGTTSAYFKGGFDAGLEIEAARAALSGANESPAE